MAKWTPLGRGWRNGSEVKIEELIGIAISRSADKELADFYSSTGNAEDARKAASRVEQIDERARSMRRPGHDPATRAQAQAFQWEGMLVQGFATLGVIAGFAALAGILLLELWPSRIRNAKTIWRRALCLIADYAPATLLVASAAFLMGFLPFQQFAEYRSSSYMLANHEHLMEALGDLNGIPDYVMGVNARVLIWAFVTIALTALLLFVLVKRIFLARHAASKPA